MTPFLSRTEDLRRRVASTLSKLPNEPSAKYVHRLRIVIRRIEGLVSYAQPDLGRKQQKALAEMAVLRKRAGKVRDLDVQSDLLKEIANGSTAADRHSISGALKQRRDKQVKRLISATAKVADSKFFSHLGRIAEKAAAAAGAFNPQNPLAVAREQLASLEATFAKQGSPRPAELHQARIQIKKVRYIAELAEETPEQQEFVGQLRSAQDALGAWHDWQELARTAEKQFHQRVNCPLLVEVRALLAAKQITATAAVRQLFGRHPELPSAHPPRSSSSTRELVRRAG